MPKTVRCPTCKADVPVPRDAEPGDRLTCPECDEAFVPPHLERKYDPEEERGYKVKAAHDQDHEDTRAKARKVMARAYADRDRKPARKPVGWFSGPEVWLVIFAVGSAGGLPFGVWLARNWNTLGPARVFWIFVALVGLLALCASLGAGAWAWLRKNR